MDKKELISVILNDIKELDLIVKGMYELEKIPGVMQELAINKTQNIQDRILRLRVKEELQPAIQQPVENFPEKPVVLVEEVKVQEKPEPQPQEMVELVEEEPEVILYQEIEPEEKPEEDSKVSETENQKTEIPKPEISDQVQPEEKKGTVFAEVKVKVQERTTTNEKFKSRVHSATTTTCKRVESRFIQNLRKAINLNQRELFGGNAGLMNSVIDKLDAMNSLEEATAYVQKEFEWNPDSLTVTDFYTLLESRFS